MSRKVRFDHPDFGVAFPCQNCIDVTDAARTRRRKFSGLPTKHQKTFSNFERRSGTEEALEAVEQFRQDDAFMITLVGPNGSGKTHLMQALGNRLLDEDVTVKYVFVPDLVDELRGGFDERNEYTTQMVYERHRAAEVLLLDDVGRYRVTEFAAEQITRLVDERYRHERHLVVSTNLTPEQMGDPHLWGPTLADRVFDAWNPKVKIAPMATVSYRTGIKWPSVLARRR